MVNDAKLTIDIRSNFLIGPSTRVFSSKSSAFGDSSQEVLASTGAEICMFALKPMDCKL
jgi:hypothetical protein